MKWNRVIHIVLIAVVIFAGVEFSLQTRETTQMQQPIISQEPMDHHHQKPTLDVTHQLKGKALLLSLKVSHFRFSIDNMGKENKQGEGHVHLYIDGTKVAKIFDDKFEFAKLTPGKHQVTVELAQNDHTSYGVKKVFSIEVK